MYKFMGIDCKIRIVQTSFIILNKQFNIFLHLVQNSFHIRFPATFSLNFFLLKFAIQNRFLQTFFFDFLSIFSQT